MGSYRRGDGGALVEEVVARRSGRCAARRTPPRAPRTRGTGRTASRSCARRAAPLRAMITAPTSTPESSAIRIAGATALPRNRPITPASLTSPMPMPPGVGERRDQQEAAGGGARDQARRLTGGVERRAEHEREHGAERGDAVGDDAVLEVDQRRGHHEQDQRHAQRDARRASRARSRRRRTAQRCPPRRAGSAGRSARRSCGSGRAAQPGEDRDVVVGLAPASRSRGSASRGDDRFVARQAVDDDVQERAEDRAEDSCEGEPPWSMIDRRREPA